MAIVIGVSFRKSGRVYYFDPDNYKLSKGDRVIVETIRGLEMGKVIFTEREINFPIENELKKIVRPATDEDLISLYQKKIMSKRALKICKNKIKEYNLEMKLIDVEYALDDSKIIFYFSADGRIDFRNLVKELAVIFKKRIELHQIGVRDEAKILGAIGLCGRPVCCNLFMPEFVPVSIKMAKEQNLSLNPERISGVCGRFMCCLKHEHDIYHEGLEKYPPIDSFVNTNKGKLKVIEQCISKDSVICETLEQERIEIPLKNIPEYAHIVEARTTADTAKNENINLKETSLKEADLFAREAINLLSNFGVNNVISSDDLDKNEDSNPVDVKVEEKVDIKDNIINNTKVNNTEVNNTEVNNTEVNLNSESNITPKKKEKFRILIQTDMIKSNFADSKNSSLVNKDKVKKTSKIKISPTLSKEIFAGTWNGSSDIINHNLTNTEDNIVEDKIEELEDGNNIQEISSDKEDNIVEDKIEELEDENNIQEISIDKEDNIIEDKIEELEDENNIQEISSDKEDNIVEDKIEDLEDENNIQEISSNKENDIIEDKIENAKVEEKKTSETKTDFKLKSRSEKRGFQPRNPFLRRNQRNNRNDHNDRKNDHRDKNDNKRENNVANDRRDKKDYNDRKFSKSKKFWLKGNNNKKNNRREDS